MPLKFHIATGHALTTEAAKEILEDGGNGADAAIAALLAACVAEPMLASMGGGGHALIQADGKPTVSLDFFAQTPQKRHQGRLDFYPIVGNFGTTTQEFHVGLASMATPGVPAGLDALHARFGSMPKKRLIEPAQRLARRGVKLNALQHHTLEILEPIVRATPEAARWAGLGHAEAPLPAVGHAITQPGFAEFLTQWAEEDARCFYEGSIAEELIARCIDRGGHLRHPDFLNYQAKWRRPLKWRYRNATLWSNPPPAFGGMMLALSTHALEHHIKPQTQPGSKDHIKALIETMNSVNEDRQTLERLHGDQAHLTRQLKVLLDRHPTARRGTTHLSIDDGQGLAISVTVSNGEGSGQVIESAGIMMNNMLGEEDLNRGGFHGWPCNRRLASMMTPTIVHHPNRTNRYLLGSGGSNRIRTALLQVVSQLIDFGANLPEAIEAPRLHLEGKHLSIELASQWSDEAQQWLIDHHREATTWPTRSLFFGGVHATGPSGASADARREGVSFSGASAASQYKQ